MQLRHLIVGAILSLGVAAFSTLDDEHGFHGNPDYICPTGNAQDCYPKVFVPTHEFRVIRPDQAIPKGLHVRVDMQTGEKEAKLYDPSEDTDEVNAVEVLPDEPLKDEPTTENINIQDQAQKVLNDMRKAKASQGETVRPPPNSAGTREVFQRQMQVLKHHLREQDFSKNTKASETLDLAVADLEDICHDVYWGLELFKDRELMQLLSQAGNEAFRYMDNQLTLLLATALQNNAAALDQLEAFVEESGWAYLQWVMQGLEDPDASNFAISRIITHISAVLPRERFFRDFFNLDGPARLRQPHERNDASMFHRVQQKVYNLLADHAGSVDAEPRIMQWAQELKRKQPSMGNVLDEPDLEQNRPAGKLCRGAVDAQNLLHDLEHWLGLDKEGGRRDRDNDELSESTLDHTARIKVPDICYADVKAGQKGIPSQRPAGGKDKSEL